MTDSPIAAPPLTAHPNRWRILWLVGIAQLMLIIDVTVVAIALPHIGSDLGVERTGLTWVVSSVAAASIAGGGHAGFSAGFATAAVVALVFGILVAIIGPRR